MFQKLGIVLYPPCDQVPSVFMEPRSWAVWGLVMAIFIYQSKMAGNCRQSFMDTFPLDVSAFNALLGLEAANLA